MIRIDGALGHGRGCGRPKPAGRAASDQAGQRRLRRVTGDVEHVAVAHEIDDHPHRRPGQHRGRPVRPRRQVSAPASMTRTPSRPSGRTRSRLTVRRTELGRRSGVPLDGPTVPGRNRGAAGPARQPRARGWSAGRPPSRCTCPPPSTPEVAHFAGGLSDDGSPKCSPSTRSGRRSAKARRSSTTWVKRARKRRDRSIP